MGQIGEMVDTESCVSVSGVLYFDPVIVLVENVEPFAHFFH
jgi:hypothetical protein